MKTNKNGQGGETDELARAYAKAFAEFLATGSEDALHAGYEIGRAALADGRSIFDIGEIHHSNIRRALARMRPPISLGRNLDRAQQFFCEILSPYEMARRGFSDALSALRRLNEMLEQEIHRIARGVHDESGQLIFAARLAMDGLAHDLDPALRDRLQEVGALLDQVEKQLRRLSHELRPTILDDLGLVAALEFLSGRISKSANLSIEIRSTLKGRCAPTIETAVYRVVQESLTNITKHAHAKNVQIHLGKVAGNLRCSVHDDGVGFDAAFVLSSAIHNGLGLIGMRERLIAVGGTLEIDSVVGQGTNLRLRIPWRSK